MIDTFYLHLEFTDKGGGWSINLPFLCTKCGTCCTLDDFLTAGEINAKPQEQPQVHAKIKALTEKLGRMWEANEAKYDEYTIHTPCPFLDNHTCSIYQIRPDGCRLFPKTAFGMQTEDCEALTRFKKQRSALKKCKVSEETYYFVGAGSEHIKSAKLTKKHYQACIAKLRQSGITNDELALFSIFNGQKSRI